MSARPIFFRTAVKVMSLSVTGAVHPTGPIQANLRPDQFAVYAGVSPEDKFAIVEAFEDEGYTVGMCGDGANDAPALRSTARRYSTYCASGDGSG